MESPHVIYPGLNLTLQCNVALDQLSGTYDVHTTVDWFKDNDRFDHESCISSSSGFHCLMNITHVSCAANSGDYSCRAIVTPKDKFLRNQTVTSNVITLDVSTIAGKYCIQLSWFEMLYIMTAQLMPALVFPRLQRAQCTRER